MARTRPPRRPQARHRRRPEKGHAPLYLLGPTSTPTSSAPAPCTGTTAPASTARTGSCELERSCMAGRLRGRASRRPARPRRRARAARPHHAQPSRTCAPGCSSSPAARSTSTRHARSSGRCRSAAPNLDEVPRTPRGGPADVHRTDARRRSTTSWRATLLDLPRREEALRLRRRPLPAHARRPAVRQLQPGRHRHRPDEFEPPEPAEHPEDRTCACAT